MIVEKQPIPLLLLLDKEEEQEEARQARTGARVELLYTRGTERRERSTAESEEEETSQARHPAQG